MGSTICALATCDQLRAPGSQFCVKHSAKGRLARIPPSAASQAEPEGCNAMICPHCQARGQVRTKQVKVKRGVSGGKATGAVLTAGLSLFATGLSRKEVHTQCLCGNCGMKWLV